MSRAVDIAHRGLGEVSPNPLVGSVVVHQGKIIGEGWHRKYGEAHAEVNALEAVSDHTLLPESTIYVTLEPCSHTGHTPPCADRIIREGIRNVVIGCTDPDPRVNGRGIDRLKKAGVRVTTGVLERECYEMNRRFFRSIEKSRPYIILKWAQTSDGFMAREDHTSKWISGAPSRHIVHKWRAEEDAILVGGGTAVFDDPSLDTRDWPGRDPLRVVLDTREGLPVDLRMFTDDKPVLLFSPGTSVRAASVELVSLPSMELSLILNNLNARNIRSVLVEGGGKILQSFIEADAWDEARVFIGPAEFGRGIRAPQVSFKPAGQQLIGQDVLLLFKNTSQWPKNYI